MKTMLYKELELPVDVCTRPENKSNRQVLHITHNDGDGVGCALVTRFMVSAGRDTYFCNTGNGADNASDVLMDIVANGQIGKYTDIIISDVSIRDDVADTIESYCKENDVRLLMVDHHPTNKLSETHDWVIMSKPIDGVPVSAAATLALVLNGKSMLKFTYFSSETDITRVSFDHVFGSKHPNMSHTFSYWITMISRYDTWEWKKHPWSGVYEDHVTNMIKYTNPIATCDHLTECIYNGTLVSDVMKRYTHMRNSELDEFYKKCIANKTFVTMEFHGYKTIAYMVIGETGINDIKERLLKNFVNVDIVMAIDPKSRNISLRCRDGHDVGKIAAEYGGGGHAGAAGANNIDHREFYECILTSYYKAQPIKFD